MEQTAVITTTAQSDATQLTVPGGTALQQMTRGEIDMQIATAKQYPRSLKKVLNDALTLATFDEETAESCWYSLSRGSSKGERNKIEGPSIRLAEIVASAWTNLRVGSMIVEVGDKTVTARGMVHDLETNVAYYADVQRSIVTRDGKRFGQDMITVTANAAASIATRNAILKVIPRVYVDRILKECKSVALGDGKTIEIRRERALAALQKLGVPLERILKAADVKGIADIGLSELEVLTGLKNQVLEGIPIDEVFPAHAAGKRHDVADRLKALTKNKEVQQPEPNSAAAVVARYAGIKVGVEHLIYRLNGRKPEAWSQEDIGDLDAVFEAIARGEGMTFDYFPNL